MSLFITFEGGEGSGKSTQAKLLYHRLDQLAIPVLLTHEPGVTSLGEKITQILKWQGELDVSPVAELLLFNVSRAQLVEEIINPALEKGQIVICDRFADSSAAYQGYARGIDISTVKQANNIATSGLTPGLTFLLDIPVQTAFSRKSNEKDRFQKESTAFHERVRKGYLSLAEDEPERWCVINATLNIDSIAGIIWERVRPLLPK